MTTLAELTCCDGYGVEGAQGLIGWVEETWLDGDDRVCALAVRTCDGRRALLRAESVHAVDADAQLLFVLADERLDELDAPRVAQSNGRLAATWLTTGAEIRPRPSEPAVTEAPALAASRSATARRERPAWQYVAFALFCIGALIAVEIGLAFGIAYLVTGRAY